MTSGGHSYLGNIEQFGDAPALLSEDGDLSYAELATAADAVGCVLGLRVGILC